LLQALAGVAVIALAQPVWRRWLRLEGDHLLSGLFLLVVVGELTALLFRGINLGQHHITAYNIVALVQRLSYLMLVAGLTAAGWLRVETVLAAWLVAVAANVTVGGWWIWRRSERAPLSWRVVQEGWGHTLKRGLRALAAISLTLVLVRADVYMIGPMLGVEAVGQISVASTFAEYLWYIPSILGSVLFAAVAASRGPETVAKICRASRTTIAALAPVVLGLLLVGRWVVILVYGHAYGQAATVFLLLLPGMFAVSLHLIIDSYFTGSGFPPITYLAAAGALLLKVAINLLLVPKMGLQGAAVATSVVYVSLLIVKVVAFSRETGVSVGTLFRPRWQDVRHNAALARSWFQRITSATADAV
jgi:O-antigen/teichoic acid export membrane protein